MLASHIKLQCTHTKIKLKKNSVRNAHTQQFSPTQLGKSLVTGYEHLGIELARPQFRSRMESDMNAIALGRKTKEHVIAEWMVIMTPVLKSCMEKSSQLIAEMHNFFQVRFVPARLLCACPFIPALHSAPYAN